MPFQQTNQNDTAIEERTLHFILCGILEQFLDLYVGLNSRRHECIDVSTDSALLVSVC